ncbi:MAG: LysR family transcriptional regulator, partial [Clostridia bacterium]|nr:LysR family transcriptional regulator [Clostridia bacterium]
LLPEYAVREELKAGTLFALPVDLPEPVLRARMLYHRNKWVTPPMQELIDLMARYRGLCL